MKPGEPFPESAGARRQRVIDEIKVIVLERRVKPHRLHEDLVNARDAGDKLTAKSCSIRSLGWQEPRCRRPAARPAARSVTLRSRRSATTGDRQPGPHAGCRVECLGFSSNGCFAFPRIATTRPKSVDGILKGMVVRPSALSPNYDPDVFPDPLSFDVHRSSSGSCRSALARSLHRQYSRPHRDHHRGSPLAGAFPEGATPIRTSRRSMAVQSANCACKAFRW